MAFSGSAAPSQHKSAPTTVAPESLASGLDSGWGDDESDEPSHLAALAPVRIPSFAQSHDIEEGDGDSKNAVSSAPVVLSSPPLAPSGNTTRHWPNSCLGTLTPVALAGGTPPVDDDWDVPHLGMATDVAADHALATQLPARATAAEGRLVPERRPPLALVHATSEALDLTIQPPCPRAPLDSDVAVMADAAWRSADISPVSQTRTTRRNPSRRMTWIAAAAAATLAALGTTLLMVRSCLPPPAPQLDGSLVPGQLREVLTDPSRHPADLSDTSIRAPVTSAPQRDSGQSEQRPQSPSERQDLLSAAPSIRQQQPTAETAPTCRGDACDTTHVQVVLQPADSRIAVHGKAAKAPHIFDVPLGRRVILEVTRRGYVTRRVVLDGTREQVVVVLHPERKPEVESAPSPPPANESTGEP